MARHVRVQPTGAGQLSYDVTSETAMTGEDLSKLNPGSFCVTLDTGATYAAYPTGTTTPVGATTITAVNGSWVLVSAPSSGAKTVATVTSVNSPYTVLSTDSLIEFDESNGNLATANLPTVPATGERHTFKWWNYVAGSPPPVINGNGKQIEPWSNPIGLPGLAGSSTIATQGGQVTWEYDGTRWVLVST